jgi:hypothetical protein
MKYFLENAKGERVELQLMFRVISPTSLFYGEKIISVENGIEKSSSLSRRVSVQPFDTIEISPDTVIPLPGPTVSDG